MNEYSKRPATLHVVVVDNDPCIRQLVIDYLGDNDFRVSGVPNGEAMWKLLNSEPVDLLILDANLAGEDGSSLACDVHNRYDIPIIILTDHTRGLAQSGDATPGFSHRIAKPFSPSDLLGRIQHLIDSDELAAIGSTRIRQQRAYRFAGWELNLRSHRLTAPNGAIVVLTAAEFHLLCAFLVAPGRILSKDLLVEAARRGNQNFQDDEIASTIERLRKKIDPLDQSREYISCENGLGYVLLVEVEYHPSFSGS